MQDTLPVINSLMLDAQGRIGRDLPCRGCGYNLRGLDPDVGTGGIAAAGCPECGMAVAHSLREDELRFSDPAWVRGLASGVRLIGGAVRAIIVGGFVAVGVLVAGRAVAPLLPIDSFRIANLIYWLTLLTAGALAMALNLVGTWRLTAPDPSLGGESWGVTLRTTARWCVLLGWIVLVLASLLVASNPVMVFFHPLAALTLLVGFIAIMRHLRRLALRLPDASLARQTSIVLWGLVAVAIGVVALVCGFIVVLAMAFSATASGSSSAADTFGAILGVFGCGWMIAALAFAIWLVVLLVKYRRRFAAAAEEAAGVSGTPIEPGAEAPVPPRV